MAHLLEVGTGFRSGNPEDPGPGEPRPCYDPAVTTLTERRWAKVAELAAMDRQEARMLGLDRVGYRTLIRWERGRERSGLIGCADDRWLRPGGHRPSIGPEIREAIFAVHAEVQGRSRVGMATRTRLIHQYVRVASSIAEDSVCRPVSESVGDQQARDCRAEMTAPERLRAPGGQRPARAAGRRNTWWQKRNSGWPLASLS
ncbi:hypothetical protein [Streptomyces sp. NPDC051569]|uniref:hypothetical protein n=1 Tax=Streptomyces sp. NPDC051569 TaxID=3365661 RepID=UPI0037AC1E5F